MLMLSNANTKQCQCKAELQNCLLLIQDGRKETVGTMELVGTIETVSGDNWNVGQKRVKVTSRVAPPNGGATKNEGKNDHIVKLKGFSNETVPQLVLTRLHFHLLQKSLYLTPLPSSFWNRHIKIDVEFLHVHQSPYLLDIIINRSTPQYVIWKIVSTYCPGLRFGWFQTSKVPIQTSIQVSLTFRANFSYCLILERIKTYFQLVRDLVKVQGSSICISYHRICN